MSSSYPWTSAMRLTRATLHPDGEVSPFQTTFTILAGSLLHSLTITGHSQAPKPVSPSVTAGIIQGSGTGRRRMWSTRLI